MLAQKDCPLIVISLILKLLHRLVQMDFRRALPVLTQLDYWTILVDLIDVQNLSDIERAETRQMLV